MPTTVWFVRPAHQVPPLHKKTQPHSALSWPAQPHSPISSPTLPCPDRSHHLVCLHIPSRSISDHHLRCGVGAKLYCDLPFPDLIFLACSALSPLCCAAHSSNALLHPALVCLSHTICPARQAVSNLTISYHFIQMNL